MASQLSSFLQYENMNINSGKAANRGGNVDIVKGSKNVNKARKPLGDISNHPKTRPPPLKEKSVLKEKSAFKEKSAKCTSAKLKSASKSKYQGLSDNEIRKYEEWAEEGVEHMSYSWVEQIAREEKRFRKRIDTAVEDIMLGLKEWCNEEIMLDLGNVGGTYKPIVEDVDDHKELPLEMEEENLLVAVKTIGEQYIEVEPVRFYDDSLSLNLDLDFMRLKEELEM